MAAKSALQEPDANIHTEVPLPQLPLSKVVGDAWSQIGRQESSDNGVSYNGGLRIY